MIANGLKLAGVPATAAGPAAPPMDPEETDSRPIAAPVDRLGKELAERNEALVREVDQLRHDVEFLSRNVADMAGLEESWSARQRELRAQLVTAHEQLLRRDEELRESVRELTAQRDAAAAQRDAASAERDALRLQRDEAVRQRDGLLVQRGALVDERNALDARLTLFRQSLPGRLYRGVRRLLG